LGEGFNLPTPPGNSNTEIILEHEKEKLKIKAASRRDHEPAIWKQTERQKKIFLLFCTIFPGILQYV